MRVLRVFDLAVPQPFPVQVVFIPHGRNDRNVRPFPLGFFEDFFCGFTKDSHPSFSVTPTTGTLERRGGPTTRLTVTCKPKGASGELVGYLCVIMPDEKDFSTFYKITCMSR